MKKPTLALHTAASHVPSLHCTGMLKDQSVASHVIKKKNPFIYLQFKFEQI